ncbi:hypothetical protein [Halomonas sp. BC04]|uniref:hypothetical protein n=1 Tax=Halomonas sp. BC04 TaxID=1403540 RepID=UPI0003ED665A|nr:hypothetical protein [Halomonas sp. BC04]EWH00106.1 hypothetical protein Q427_21275 [Halomonas sp. BC04]
MSQTKEKIPCPSRLGARFLFWSLSSLLMLLVSALVGTNLLLNSAWTQNWIDRRLPHLTVTWDTGWSFWPGRLHLQGLTIERHAAELPLYLAVDEANVRIAAAG